MVRVGCDPSDCALLWVGRTGANQGLNLPISNGIANLANACELPPPLLKEFFVQLSEEGDKNRAPGASSSTLCESLVFILRTHRRYAAQFVSVAATNVFDEESVMMVKGKLRAHCKHRRVS